MLDNQTIKEGHNPLANQQSARSQEPLAPPGEFLLFLTAAKKSHDWFYPERLKSGGHAVKNLQNNKECAGVPQSNYLIKSVQRISFPTGISN